jgi:4-methyl-5(b-hydroxyethyl)-thiazole monophosphate biosynthesis
MEHKMYLLLADGFEEVEAFTPTDYLRRAGINVMLVSTNGEQTVTGAHGIMVCADMAAEIAVTVPDCVGIILPGGMPGAINLARNPEVQTLLEKARETSALICAICAAPAVVLAPKGLLAGRSWTCYPGMEKEAGAAIESWKDERVVVDQNIITARGPGIAGEWSIKIIEKLLGPETASKIARSVLLN